MLQTITARINNVKRLLNTKNGGPRYLITTDTEWFQTKGDCMDSYGWMPERLVGHDCTITLDNDRIIDIEPIMQPSSDWF